MTNALARCASRHMGMCMRKQLPAASRTVDERPRRQAAPARDRSPQARRPARRQEVIERHGARARDGEPEKDREIEGLVEAEQRREAVDAAPLRRADRDDHDDAESARRYARE